MNRRSFISSLGTSSAALAAWPMPAFDPASAGRTIRTETAAARQPKASARPPVAFAAIGLNHSHIYSQVETMLANGATLSAVYAKEPELVAAFTKRYPQARVARAEQEILDDKAIQLVVSAAIPNERAPLGIRVMQAGKDFMVDKPGVTTLAHLADVRRVQAQTRRIYSILYGGRLESPATQRAVELVHAGAIGQVVHTMGTGPHKIGANPPRLVLETRQFGGVLGDLGTHQVDYFLALHQGDARRRGRRAGRQPASPRQARFRGFRRRHAAGRDGRRLFPRRLVHARGVATFGDSRLTVMGTDGYLEERPNVDFAGRPGGNHLFLVDQKETRYIDAKDTPCRTARDCSTTSSIAPRRR